MTGDSTPALLEELLSMRIEEPGATRSFEAALAEAQGWSDERAEAVSREYRRFLYLAATAGREVTPSRAVDKAWHLHLTYTDHYWGTLCPRILGQPLHHRPSPGGAHESRHYRSQYEDTLALYEGAFGEPAPPSTWPRPAAEPAMEDRRARPAWRVPAALAVLVAFAAAVYAGSVALFVLILLALMFLTMLPVVRGSRLRRGGGSAGAAGSCGGGGLSVGGWGTDCADGAGCGGGCGGD
jgi:hypothetical protein